MEEKAQKERFERIEKRKAIADCKMPGIFERRGNCEDDDDEKRLM